MLLDVSREAARNKFSVSLHLQLPPLGSGHRGTSMLVARFTNTVFNYLIIFLHFNKRIPVCPHETT